MFPVLKALRNTIIYHLGSVALGAFIIAIIQFVRVSKAAFINFAKLMKLQVVMDATCTAGISCNCGSGKALPSL